jgi:D-sedoheptulose 7-phosphate isomerase
VTYSDDFLATSERILAALDRSAIEECARRLAALRERGGRLFIVGSGGGAGHASHAVNDFRKIARIESYTPTDNVSELTARINDDGWENAYVDWLKGSRFGAADMLLVFSVGGGDAERGVSVNLVRCIDHARELGAEICGIVGRDGGYTLRAGSAVIVVPPLDPDAVTPQTEGFQALLWHLLVSHPLLKVDQTRWESLR